MKKLLLSLLLLVPLTSQAQKIQLFMLADPADARAAKDRTEMENFWKYAGPYIDYPVNTYTASNQQTLLSLLKSTPITPGKDVVVFYFSGRGEAADDRSWPVMKFKSGEEMHLRDVLGALRNRPEKPHLTMVIADCDNQPEPEYISKLIPRPHPPALRESAQELFLGKLEAKKLFITIASASTGQRALRDKNGNSVFLGAFLATIKEKLAEPQPRWGLNSQVANSVKSSLIEKVQQQTNGLQKPRFNVVVQADPDDD